MNGVLPTWVLGGNIATQCAKGQTAVRGRVRRDSAYTRVAGILSTLVQLY